MEGYEFLAVLAFGRLRGSLNGSGCICSLNLVVLWAVFFLRGSANKTPKKYCFAGAFFFLSKSVLCFHVFFLLSVRRKNTGEANGPRGGRSEHDTTVEATVSSLGSLPQHVSGKELETAVQAVIARHGGVQPTGTHPGFMLGKVSVFRVLCFLEVELCFVCETCDDGGGGDDDYDDDE